MFNERHIGYPVLRNDDLVGIVTLDDAADIKEVEQDAYRVEDVMTAEVKTITPDADAMDAFQRLQQSDVGHLPVVDEAGNLVGLITWTDLMRAFGVIQTSGIPQTLRQSGPGKRSLEMVHSVFPAHQSPVVMSTENGQ